MQGPSKPPTHLFNASYTQPQIYFYSYQVSNQQPRVIAPFEVSNSQQQRPPQVNTYPIYAYPNQQMYVAAHIVAHNQNLQQQQVQQNPMKPSPNPETKEDEEDERLTEFRALKVFPLFGDRNIAKFSCNYHLYFELFRKSIRLCIVLLVFSGIVELVLMFLKKNDNWVYAGYQLMVYLIIMLVTLIVYILMWRREQGLFAKDEILQDLQWTENMFAVRIKGLQKTVKKEDIIVHINGVLKRRPNLAASGYVKDVIFLHDLAEYNKLQKKIKEARAKINTIGGLEGEYNNSKIVEYGERERAMELEILRGKYFKGKAIIILNSIGAKVALLKWYESRAWSSSSSPAPLSANKFILRECEEPGDIKYENLHYPKCSKMIRHGIAFVLSKLTLYIGFLILFIYNMAAAVRSNDTDQTDTDKTGNAVAGIFFAIIDMGFGALYGVCQGTLYISKSDTTSDMKKLTYSIVSSALIEGFVQGISIGLTYSIWSFEYIYIPAVIFGKRILFILISFLLNIEFFTDLIEDYKFSNGLAVKVATYFRKITTSFDVISGTENITGVLYLAFAFLARSPLLILPVTIVILLLSAVIEKYILINYSEEITKRKSPYLMTKTYRILHHGCLVIMLGTLSNLIFIDEGLPGDITYNEYKIWTYIAFGTIGVGILVFFFFGKYVFSFDLMENLYKTRRDVEYDQVSKNFFLTFSNTNPGSLISQKYAKPVNP